MDDDLAEIRERLRRLLRLSVEQNEGLLSLLDDPAVSLARIVDTAALLERLDDQREDLVSELKSESRRLAIDEAGDKPIRVLVLDALKEMTVPQNAAFLQEFIWGRFGIDLETRGFGTLRRDEKRSWERNRDKRAAFVAPALSSSGEARADYMTRSDWPVSRRIILPETERILDLYKVMLLLLAWQDESARPTAFDEPLSRYATQLFEVEPLPSMPVGTWAGYLGYSERQQWREKVSAMVRAELMRLEPGDEAARVRAAALIAEYDQEEKVWGAWARRPA